MKRLWPLPPDGSCNGKISGIRRSSRRSCQRLRRRTRSSIQPSLGMHLRLGPSYLRRVSTDRRADTCSDDFSLVRHNVSTPFMNVLKGRRKGQFPPNTLVSWRLHKDVTPAKVVNTCIHGEDSSTAIAQVAVKFETLQVCEKGTSIAFPSGSVLRSVVTRISSAEPRIPRCRDRKGP